MLLTRADQAKRALVDLLQAAPAFGDVQVEYSDQGQENWRESVYPGAVLARTDGEGEIKLEITQIPLFIRVVAPEKTPEEADQRLVELGQAVQDALVAAPHPFGPGSWWDIRELELGGVRTGDEAVSTLTLVIELRAYL